MDLRKLVSDELTRRSWTVYRLGKESSVNDTTIARWLAGERKINSDYLEKILIALEFEIEPKKSANGID